MIARLVCFGMERLSRRRKGCTACRRVLRHGDADLALLRKELTAVGGCKVKELPRSKRVYVGDGRDIALLKGRSSTQRLP